MRAQFIAVAFVTASLSMTAFAEQPVQAGETLESLSKAKVTTTVNGQSGSLEELVKSGKVQLISGQSHPVQTQPMNSQDIQAVAPHQSDMTDPAATSAPSIDPNAPAQAIPESAQPEAPAMQAAPANAQDQNSNVAPEHISEPVNQ